MSGALGTTGEVAARLRAELVGPSDVPLRGLETLASAGEGQLTFVRSALNLEGWASSRASAVLAPRAVYGSSPGAFADGRAVIVVEDSDLALIELLEALDEVEAHVPGIDAGAHVDATAQVDPTAWVGPSARVGDGARIGAGARIHGGASVGRGVVIGEGSEIRENVVIYARTVIGRGVVIHAGAVIGADGFGYRPSADGRGVVKIPHVGNVELGDGVEIGACTTIDRGKFGATRIGAGTKIDNQVQIGHNCVIGRCCIICGCVGIAGSVTVGDGVTIAGGVGIADNLTIGDGATLGAQSGVIGDVAPGVTVLGSPARESGRYLRNAAVFDMLAESYRKLKPILKDET